MAEITKVDADKLSIMVGQLLAKNVSMALFRKSTPKMHSKYLSSTSTKPAHSQKLPMTTVGSDYPLPSKAIIKSTGTASMPPTITLTKSSSG